MGKFSQASKMLWWKAKGMSQEDMAKKLAEDPEVQQLMGKIQQGIREGKITQKDLLVLQKQAMSNPKEAQKAMDELLKKL